VGNKNREVAKTTEDLVCDCLKMFGWSSNNTIEQKIRAFKIALV
jgi:hypothetical protein